MFICVFCMHEVADEDSVCCGTYKGITEVPDDGKPSVNYNYPNGKNITYLCTALVSDEGDECNAPNIGVDVDLERGDRTAYSDPTVLYGTHKCETCGHARDFEFSLGE